MHLTIFLISPCKNYTNDREAVPNIFGNWKHGWLEYILDYMNVKTNRQITIYGKKLDIRAAPETSWVWLECFISAKEIQKCIFLTGTLYVIVMVSTQWSRLDETLVNRFLSSLSEQLKNRSSSVCLTFQIIGDSNETPHENHHCSYSHHS